MTSDGHRYASTNPRDRKMSLLVAAAMSVLSAAMSAGCGCGTGPNTEIPLLVEVLDARTSSRVCGADVFLEGEGERLRLEAVTTPQTCRYTGAPRKAGDYTLRVEHPDYETRVVEHQLSSKGLFCDEVETSYARIVLEPS